MLEGGIDSSGLHDHLDHVHNLFPDEPRLVLARGIAEEQFSAPSEVLTRSVAAANLARARELASRAEGERFRAAERAAARFKDAAKDESLRAEASLRLGHVKLLMGRYDEALAALSGAERGTEDRARDLSRASLSRHGAREPRARRRGARLVPAGAGDQSWRALRDAASGGDGVPPRPRRRPGRDDRRAPARRRSTPRSLVVVLRRRLAILVSAHRARARDAEAACAVTAGPAEARPTRVGQVDVHRDRCAAGHRDAGRQERVFRSGVDGVTITVSVRSNNRPVSGLTAADFELTDNGVPQELTTIAAEKVPLDLTLLLDLSSSVDGPMLQRLKTAVSDTAALLRPDDRIRLVAISQVLHEVFSLRPRGDAMPLDSLKAEGATSLYDGIAATMMRPSEPGRRQLIVAYSDGQRLDQHHRREDREGDRPPHRSRRRHRRPVAGHEDDTGSRRLSQRNTVDSLSGGDNVTLGASGPQNRPGDRRARRCSRISVGPTSGQVFALASDDSVSRVFKAMLDDFRASYVLQYVPQGVAPDGWHEVRGQREEASEIRHSRPQGLQGSE